MMISCASKTIPVLSKFFSSSSRMLRFTKTASALACCPSTRKIHLIFYKPILCTPVNNLCSHKYLVTTSNYNCNNYSSYRIKAADDLTEGPLTKSQANEIVPRLTEEERTILLTTLQEYESRKIKSEYEGQLAAARWRSKFGRPSKLPTLGDVDPTGSYCQLNEDWLKQKYAENVPPPTLNQLINVAVYNAVPFIGFGFLDNAIMIVAGDYIELSLGSFITISTMAAAALGNTISDVMGIGSAWYVEYLASKVGLRPPALSPIQLDMGSARRFSNLGRAMGIIIGCLLGMVPLLFISKSEENEDPSKAKPKK